MTLECVCGLYPVVGPVVVALPDRVSGIEGSGALRSEYSQHTKKHREAYSTSIYIYIYLYPYT